MGQEIVIGASVAVTVAVVFIVKSLLYKVLNFKMDESAIFNFLERSDGDHESLGTAAISAGTGIAMERVVAVCSKSKAIMRDLEKDEFWYLKQQASV